MVTVGDIIWITVGDIMVTVGRCCIRDNGIWSMLTVGDLILEIMVTVGVIIWPVMVTVGRYCIRDNCQWSMLTVEDYLADNGYSRWLYIMVNGYSRRHNLDHNGYSR